MEGDLGKKQGLTILMSRVKWHLTPDFCSGVKGQRLSVELWSLVHWPSALHVCPMPALLGWPRSMPHLPHSTSHRSCLASDWSLPSRWPWSPIMSPTPDHRPGSGSRFRSPLVGLTLSACPFVTPLSNLSLIALIKVACPNVIVGPNPNWAGPNHNYHGLMCLL